MSIASEELASLDIDVLDILYEYGSTKLTVKQFVEAIKDDVYEEETVVTYKEPVPVEGLVSKETPDIENPLGMGKQPKTTIYTIKILKTSYPNTLTEKDIICLDGKELIILSINPMGTIGDDFLMYTVRAKEK